MPGHAIELQFGGLEELKAALRALPKELASDGIELVDDAVEVTAARLFQAYPIGPPQRRTPGQAAHVPGALRRGIRKTLEGTPWGGFGIVKSTSPHAHLWEFGTQSRRTSKGWARGTQRKQYNQGLIGISIQERRKLNNKLIDLVKSAGFQVSGSF